MRCPVSPVAHNYWPLTFAPPWMARELIGGTVIAILPSAPTVTLGPVQPLPSGFNAPLVTSQYVPGGILVCKVFFSSESSRLIATKPLSPRPNAIALLPLLHQSVTCRLDEVKLRKPTMPAISAHRCSQTHRPLPQSAAPFW